MFYGSIRKLNLITRQDQYFISAAFLIPNFPPPSIYFLNYSMASVIYLWLYRNIRYGQGG